MKKYRFVFWLFILSLTTPFRVKGVPGPKRNSSSLQNEIRQPRDEGVYAEATYDSMFKKLMGRKEIMQSFLETFLPEGTGEIHLEERLTENLNPVVCSNRLYNFLRHEELATLLTMTEEEIKFNVNIVSAPSGAPQSREVKKPHKAAEEEAEKKEQQARKALKTLRESLISFQNAAPAPTRNSQLDVIWEGYLNKEPTFFMIEMQRQWHQDWDERQLCYASAVYSGHPVKGDEWVDLKNVVSLSILCKRGDLPFWGPEEELWKKHYTVNDKKKSEIKTIQIFQYSIHQEGAHEETRPALTEWLDCLKNSVSKKPEHIQQLQTEVLKNAVYPALRVPKIIDSEWRLYQKEKMEQESIEPRLDETRKKARQEGTEELAMKQIARAVKNKNTFLKYLIEDTGFSTEELEAIWNKYEKEQK